MASQNLEQSTIQSIGLDPHEIEPIRPDWLLYGFPDFHLPDSDFLARVFHPGFLDPDDRSDSGSTFQSSSEWSDDLEDELLGQPATESSDDLEYELPVQPTTESSGNLGDEPLGQARAELSGELADELLVQPTTGPFIQTMTSFSSYSVNLEEIAEDWIRSLTSMISQMMFVSGETSEASVETTTIIEEIVHTQVTEIVGFTSSPQGSEFHVLIIVYIAPALNPTC